MPPPRDFGSRPCPCAPFSATDVGRGAGVLLLAALLLLTACSSDAGSTRQQTATSPPTQPPPLVTQAAAPPAAGITGAPRTPAPAGAPPVASAVETAVRRVALFATDLPPGMAAQPAVLEDNAAAAQRAADPAEFSRRTTQWGRVAAFHTRFDAPASPARAGTVVLAASSAIGFSTGDGARAQLAALRTDGADALTGSPVIPPDLILGPPPWEAVPPPAVGDEALAWQSGPGAGRPAAAAVAFRRGTMVVVVIMVGDGDIASLARTLDERASAAQR